MNMELLNEIPSLEDRALHELSKKLVRNIEQLDRLHRLGGQIDGFDTQFVVFFYWMTAGLIVMLMQLQALGGSL